MKLPVSIDLLRLFVRVAERGSIAAAARELNVSPSLATRHVAAMEKTLNVRLFQRTTRSVKLTEPGAVALRWARQTLSSYDTVYDELGSIATRPSGTIRLAINQYAGATLLPRILDDFCREYPEIRFSIATTDSMVNPVNEGFDLAIHNGSVPDSSLIGVRILEFRRVICASPDYLARHGTPTRPEDLGKHPCLVHSTHEPLNWFFRRGKRLTAQPVNRYIEADNHNLLLEFVRQGLGIARLGDLLVKSDLASGRLVELMPEYKCVYSTGELPGMWLLYPNRDLLFRTRLFIDFLTGSFARLSARGDL